MSQADLPTTLAEAMHHALHGDKRTARRLLRAYLERNPTDAAAWVWLAFIAATTEEKRATLHRALRLNPTDTRVQSALGRLYLPQQVALAAQDGVFVSYSRADEVFVAQLVDDLRRAGVRVWLDIADIPDGADWYRAVDDALNRCGVLLAVLSPGALRAENVRRELERFLGVGKVVVPVLHEPCDVDALALHLPVTDAAHPDSVRQLTTLLCGDRVFTS